MAQSAARKGFLLLGGALLLVAAPVYSATPASGTLSLSTPEISYSSGPFVVSNVTGTAGSTVCGGAGTPCDDYALTVSLPADYAITHPYDQIRIETSWAVPAEDIDLYLLEGETSAEYADSASSSDPEVIVLSAGGGTRTFTVRLVPYTVAGASPQTTISLISGTAPVPAATGVAPRFKVHMPPDGIASGAGEPSVGLNRSTGRAMFIAHTEVDRVTFAEDTDATDALGNKLPPAGDAVWEDVSPTTTVTTLDPILFTDFWRGRTFVSQLIGANSLYVYTDDDGANWQPAQIAPPSGGLDHQTTGSGPYPAGQPFDALRQVSEAAGFGNAVYYCAQSVVTAFCARSDDGGRTFGSGTPTWKPLECSGLHGHVRVAYNGTVAVPNKRCDSQQGVTISKDAGTTWSVSVVPGTVAGRTDPQLAWSETPDPATKLPVGYFCFIDGDGRAKAAVTKDQGESWSTPIDLGFSHGVAKAVFAQGIAGDHDRAACAFLGTTTDGAYDSEEFKGVWYPFVATTYNAGANWQTVNVSPQDPVQGAGGICTKGVTCGSNRNLLDFNEMTVDDEGRVLFGYADGCIGACVVDPSKNSFSEVGRIARQSGGRTLFAKSDTQPRYAAVELVPAAPFLQGVRNDTGVALSWNAPDDGGAAISGYRIYRGTTPGAETLLVELTQPKLSYADTTAAPTTGEYSYKVSAVNAKGESVFSNVLVPGQKGAVAVASPCELPGVLVAKDAENDQRSGAAGHDARALYIAEPYFDDGSERFVISMQVDNLTLPPPNTLYEVHFKLPGDDPALIVERTLTYDSTTGEFSYGHRSPGTGGVNSSHTDGQADDSSALDVGNNRIVWVLTKSKMPGLANAKLITGANAQVWQNAVAGTLRIDDGTGGDYSPAGNAACMPNELPIAALIAVPQSGTAPLSVQFTASASDADGDAITEYTLNFGDGSPEVTQATAQFTHSYTQAGYYSARLKARDAKDGLSTNLAEKVIEVSEAGGGSTGTTTGGTENDTDGDGTPNDTDNCPTVSNADQANVDHDEAGDACDSVNNADPDNDGVNDPDDNCPTTANPDQDNADQDEAGDACDSVNSADPDNDGLANSADNCPNVANPDQADADGDDIGDACDAASNNGPNGDNDGDSVVNGTDNCPAAPNGAQGDADGDGAGDVCDSVNNSDQDGDGKPNASDNCPAAPNAGQTDSDGDGAGDVCDNTNHIDSDGDGTPAADDNCPNNANPGQEDVDGDGKGDACDPVNDLDDDGDGVADGADNCPAVPNRGQADGDGDGVGDHCDATFNDDTDGDSIVNGSDNCPSVPNSNQRNQDNDRYGDACDADQGNGGGTAKVNRASAEPIAADAGSGIRVGDLVLKNISSRKHRVESIQLKLTNPQNIARIYGTVDGVRFNCAPAQPAAINTCVADAVLELQPGQQLTVDIWVELTQATAKLQLTAIDLSTSGGGLMLIGTVGLGLGRRRYRAAALIAAALLLSACGDKGSSGSEVDPKLSTVTLEAVEVRDDANAPVDYGLPVRGTEVGSVEVK